MSGIALNTNRRRAYRHALARVRQLERALAPFAAEAEEWCDSASDRYQPGVTEPRKRQAHGRAVFNLGHLRRASRLLKDIDR